MFCNKGMYILTIKVKGNIGHNEKRHCQTCGCDITKQKPNLYHRNFRLTARRILRKIPKNQRKYIRTQ
jgi:hypothetical protein